MTPFVNAISSNFPDLPVASIELAGEGMDNFAFLVNREWVFRFPKFDEVSAGIVQTALAQLGQQRPGARGSGDLSAGESGQPAPDL